MASHKQAIQAAHGHRTKGKLFGTSKTQRSRRPRPGTVRTLDDSLMANGHLALDSMHEAA